MKPEHHHLLHDLLDDNDALAQRGAVLDAGRRVMRHRRYLQYLRHTFVGAACVALMFLAVRTITVPRSPVPAAGAKLAAVPPIPPVPRVQEITDDELLALFPGVPVGLVNVDGKQRLIFPRPGDEARFIVHL